MTVATKDSNASKFNGAIDIAKFLMAVLVIGIHTSPFGFNFWLDKGFALFTRLSVPFFFVVSAYLFWRKEKSPMAFLKRTIILYAVWSIIYLPFSMHALSKMTVPELLKLALWDGFGHGLWYLCALINGFIITYVLQRFLKPKYVLIIAFVCLAIGTAKSTYSTAIYKLFGIILPDNLGTRNGLFYGFPYMALGMAIAKSDTKGLLQNKNRIYAGFAVSLILLLVESYIFIMRFKANSTILWLSVFPYSYFFFEIVLNANIPLEKSMSLTFRKMSTLMYVSQNLFLPVLKEHFSYMPLFFLLLLVTSAFSFAIIKLSEKKGLGFLNYLY